MRLPSFFGIAFTIVPVAARAVDCATIHEKVEVKQNQDAPVHIIGYFASKTSNALDVKFSNKTAKTITAIVWEIRAGNGAAFIRDAGSFAPNVAISHCGMAYGLQGGNYVWLDQARIRAVRVTFADGTQWATPDAPPDEPDFNEPLSRVG